MFGNELEKMKEQHDLKMEKLKLQGELSIEEDRVRNQIRLNKLNAEKEQLGKINSIRELKNDVKRDRGIIKAGSFLNFWGTMGTIVSTLLTIAGLWNFFNHSYLKAISFVLSVILTQFSVYILAKQDTNIRKYFMQHASKVSLLKFSLLSISIYGNYKFFISGRTVNFIEAVVTIALCISIDLISIYCISIAQDFKTLNKNVSTDSLYRGLIGKILYNSTFKLVNGIETKYKDNKNNILENTEIKQITTNEKVTALANDRDIEKVKSAILNYRDENICPSLNALSDITGLNKNIITAAKKHLEKKGLIKTEGRTTFIIGNVS